MAQKQYGFSLLLLTLIAGFLLGLIVAACVSFYINNAEIPFRDNFHSPEKITAAPDWNPNASLEPGQTVITPTPPPLPAQGSEATQGLTTDNLIADTSSGTSAQELPAAQQEPTIQYYVQVNALTSIDKAEEQRASLAMMGARASISEVKTSGQTVYRIRTGPFVTKAEAEAEQKKLAANGVRGIIQTN